MKKILLILSAACFMFVVACGPSAEEQAAEKKRVEDSTAAYMQHVNDSIAAVATEAQRVADSTAAAAAEAQRVADSSAAVAKKKPKAKTIEQKKKEEAKKATQGRG